LGRFLEVNIAGLLGGCVSRSLIPLGSATVCSLLVHRMLVIGHRHFFALLTELLVFTVVYVTLAYPFVLLDHDRKEIKRYLRNIASRERGVYRSA
jgi:hypothetical protein